MFKRETATLDSNNGKRNRVVKAEQLTNDLRTLFDELINSDLDAEALYGVAVKSGLANLAPNSSGYAGFVANVIRQRDLRRATANA